MADTTFTEQYNRIQKNISDTYDKYEELGLDLSQVTQKNSDNLPNVLGNFIENNNVIIANGNKDEYEVASGKNVTAGDFVTYLNNISLGTMQINNSYNYDSSSSLMSGVALDNSKVFIAHRGGGTDYKKLYASIFSISETTVSRKTITQLDSSDDMDIISIVKLTDTTVFILYKYWTSDYLYGMICTINGTTITKGSSTIIVSSSRSKEDAVVTLLNQNTILITYQETWNYNYYYLHGIICTIDGTTITKGDVQDLNNSSIEDIKALRVQLLNDNRFFILITTSPKKVYGMICTIDGTTITPKQTTPTLLFSSPNDTSFSIVSATDINIIKDNTFLITHTYILNDNKYIKYLIGTCENDIINIQQNQDTSSFGAGSTPRDSSFYFFK